MKWSPILKNILPIFFLLFFSLIFLGKDINKKLIGHHDWNSVVYASSARSLIGKAETGEIFYQQDYPPLLPLLLALNFLIFGIQDWSVRLVPISFTFFTILILFFLVKKLYSEKEAIITCFFYLNTPLIRYFGKIAVHETITPFFALLVFYVYWLWFKKETFKKFLLLILLIFLAEQAGWPGYYPVPLLTLHYLLFGKKKKVRKILCWWFISFFSFGIFLFADYLILKKIPFLGLFNIFLTRAALTKETFYNFTWSEFINKEFLWLRVYLTRVLTLLAIFGGFLLIKEFFLPKKKPKTFFVFLIGIFGLIHLLLFRQLSWLHDYMIIYLFPFLTIISAKVLSFISQKLRINFYLLLFFTIFLMFIESHQFLRDLEKASDFYPAYRLGKLINQKTQSGEKIYLASLESSKLYGVFFYFYANRNYGVGEPSLLEFLEKKEQLKNDYRFFVVDQTHNRLEDKILNYLMVNFDYLKVDNFLIFDLKNLYEGGNFN